MKNKPNSKTLANWSLGIMGTGFLGTLPFDHSIWGKILQGGFEAGLVGGLADWFAVTALFRHPLNIPIPHTALLPKNREKIIAAILNVMENEWLTKESIIQKVENVQIAHLILDRVEKEIHTDEMKKHLKEASLFVAKKINLAPFESHIEQWAKNFMGSVKTDGIVKKAIDKALESQLEEKLYGVALQVIDSKLSNEETKNKIVEMINKVVEKKSENKLFGLAIKPLMNMVGSKKMAEMIDAAITELLKDLKDENSENRKKVITYIRQELEQLKTNENVLSQIEKMKQSMIEEYDMKPLIETMNEKLHDILVDYVNKEGFVENNVLPIVEKGIQKLKEHPTALDRLDRWIKEKVVEIVEQNHQKIGQLVRDNLEKMTNEEITELLEDKLGKDITWIRVNGALCGCLIGLALTGIKLITGS